MLAIGNLKMNFTPNANSKLIYNGQFQFIRPNNDNLLQSTFEDQLSIFKNEEAIDSEQINQFFEWHNKFSLKHITTLVLNHRYENKKDQNNWISNTPFLNEYLKYQSDNTYDILQNKSIISNNIGILAKHYWVLNNLHHLNVNVGNSLDILNLETLDQQLMSDGSSINLFDNEFDNRIRYSLNNFFVGLEYKFKMGK